MIWITAAGSVSDYLEAATVAHQWGVRVASRYREAPYRARRGGGSVVDPAGRRRVGPARAAFAGAGTRIVSSGREPARAPGLGAGRGRPCGPTGRARPAAPRARVRGSRRGPPERAPGRDRDGSLRRLRSGLGRRARRRSPRARARRRRRGRGRARPARVCQRPGGGGAGDGRHGHGEPDLRHRNAGRPAPVRGREGGAHSHRRRRRDPRDPLSRHPIPGGNRGRGRPAGTRLRPRPCLQRTLLPLLHRHRWRHRAVALRAGLEPPTAPMRVPRRSCSR